ncbi:MAG TPA: YHS domain-containing (seleno)protein [Falsiroseomonas sp.]|jgi:YHS domain-containing protein|nr:YHS domain-containing (seleno)protein [Falsiroseomonas sp.]
MTRTQKLSRRSILLGGGALGIGLVGGAGRAHAFVETSPSDVNVDAQGLALRGHDPVAYQTQGRQVQGQAQFTATHQGATYHFASAANRDSFRADPARYAAAYGGFCAMGVAMGMKLDGDPALFRVVDNRLYLNVSAPVQQRWIQDIPGHIGTANERWPQLLGKAPRELNG